MSQTPVETGAPALQPFAILRLRPAVELTDDQFFELCQLNRDLRLERTAQGDIIVMPPTGFETGKSQRLDHRATVQLDEEGRYRRGVRFLNGIQATERS